jgi:fructose 1,6-bisphosphate aldolase/phosphatase
MKRSSVKTMGKDWNPLKPHRLPLEEMEYTTMPEVAKKLAQRFQDI